MSVADDPGGSAPTRPFACLEVDAGAEAAWDAVADQREQELQAGTIDALPLELLVAKLDARFPGWG
jgi:hypothetical protein